MTKYILFASLMVLLFSGTDCRKDNPPCTTCPPPDGDCNTAICKMVDNAGNPDWSPTGERFAFLRIADSMLCLYYFSDKHIEQLVNGEEPSFSPDGKKLVYEWHREVYIIDIETKATKKIDKGITPNWSENGKWIAYGNYTAFKRRSTGEIIPGQPNPDSSIYVYDVEADTIGRIIINHLNPPTGSEVGISYPTWILHDTYLAFATEPQIAAVPRGGGDWIQWWNLPPPNAQPITYAKNSLRKASDDGDFLGIGQISWNRRSIELAYYEGASEFPGGIKKFVRVIVYVTDSNRWGLAYSNSSESDPCWANDSIQSLYVNNNAIYKMDVSKPAN